MSLTISPIGDRALEIDVRGKLREQDYEQFIPLAEERIEQHGRLDLLVHLAHLTGWSPGAIWKDLKFDARHYNDIGRLAVVGSDKEWVAKLSKPLTGATVEFFPESQIEDARRWVGGLRASHEKDETMPSAAEELSCAACGQKFRFEDLGRIAALPDDRCYVVCDGCGTKNEIVAEPAPGLGEPPHAYIVGVLKE